MQMNGSECLKYFIQQYISVTEEAHHLQSCVSGMQKYDIRAI